MRAVHRRGVGTGGRWSKGAGGGAVLVVGSVLALAACGGGPSSAPVAPHPTDHRTQPQHHTAPVPSTAPSLRPVTLSLQNGQRIHADLPSSPLGATGTAVPGLDLEAWSVQREGDAVTVVVALHNVGSTLISDTSVNAVLTFQESLDVNGGQDVPTEFNSVGLLDTSSLKEYLTFAKVQGGEVKDCLCSAVPVIELKPGARMYLAAVVAAPPASTTHATLVTSAASLSNLPISG